MRKAVLVITLTHIESILRQVRLLDSAIRKTISDQLQGTACSRRSLLYSRSLHDLKAT